MTTISSIVLKRMPNEDERIAKQARVILEVLKSKGGTLTLEQLTKDARGRLKTVQKVPAVFNHYCKALVKGGFVRVVKMKAGAR